VAKEEELLSLSDRNSFYSLLQVYVVCLSNRVADCLLHSWTDSCNLAETESRCEFDCLSSILVIDDSTHNCLYYRRGSRNKARMTAYNNSKYLQSSASSSASLASEINSENDRASQHSSGSSAESVWIQRTRHESDTEDTENCERTENKRLRHKVKSLRAELHTTLDCLEQAHAKQKRLTELKVSAVLVGLSDRYAGYENRKVVYSWEREQREQQSNADRSMVARNKLARCQAAAQQVRQARLRATMLGASLPGAGIQAPHNQSARRPLI
jgi:hypothetical protein